MLLVRLSTWIISALGRSGLLVPTAGLLLLLFLKQGGGCVLGGSVEEGVCEWKEVKGSMF